MGTGGAIRRVWVVLAPVALLAWGCAVARATAPASPTWTWQGPLPAASASEVSGLSCPTVSFCVAVDRAGEVLTTSNAGAATATWSVAHVTSAAFTRVSCAGVSLCVAGDNAGDVLVATNPAGGAAAWTATNVAGGATVEDVACATGCVAVDSAGQVIISTDPTGGASAWQALAVDGTTPILSVACAESLILYSPSTEDCVAGDAAGNELSGTGTPGKPSSWSVAPVDAGHAITGVSCVQGLHTEQGSASVTCLAVDDRGDAGSTAIDPGHALSAISCPSSFSCTAVDDAGNELDLVTPSGWAKSLVAVSGAPSPGAPLVDVSCPALGTCYLLTAADPTASMYRSVMTISGTRPAIVDEPATNVTTTSATLNAVLYPGTSPTTNPAGSYAFAYRPSSDVLTWRYTPPAPIVLGSAPTIVRASITGLQPDTSYTFVAAAMFGDARYAYPAPIQATPVTFRTAPLRFPPGRVGLLSRRLTVNRGAAVVRLGCSGAPGAVCAGALGLRTAGARCGAARYRLAARRRLAVRLVLRAACRVRLASAPHPRLAATLTLDPAGGSRPTRAAVALIRAAARGR